MQLAATQRAHPPPVPPRPSRQVVAEVLKKSPRPPCPTRQAPAPPANQRPWQEGAATGGRTIVYDSAHLPANNNNNNSSSVTNNNHKLAPEEQRPKRPVSLAREPPRPVNGHAGADEQHADPKADDTSKRKDGQAEPEPAGAARAEEAQERGSAERRKRKGLNVSFKEECAAEAAAEAPSPRACATVVVIDEGGAAEASASPPGSPDQERDNIQRQDWLEAGVRYSSTKITLPAEEAVAVANGLHEEEPPSEPEFGDLDFSSIIERIAMSSLQGLPPLPRSLSGFNLNGAGLTVEPAPPPPARSSSKSQRAPKTPSTTSLSSQGSRPSPQGRQLTTLDTQLAILRREMFGLRQLDLSLLSQLWSLNESIQEFRQLLQEQEDRAPSPSPSSEEGDDTSYSGGSAQPPPPPRRPAPTTPHHHYHHHQQQQQQQHHHHHPHHPHHPHRPAARSRSSTLPPSDESPSSEEYGAV